MRRSIRDIAHESEWCQKQEDGYISRQNRPVCLYGRSLLITIEVVVLHTEFPKVVVVFGDSLEQGGGVSRILFLDRTARFPDASKTGPLLAQTRRPRIGSPSTRQFGPYKLPYSMSQLMSPPILGCVCYLVQSPFEYFRESLVPLTSIFRGFIRSRLRELSRKNHWRVEANESRASDHVLRVVMDPDRKNERWWGLRADFSSHVEQSSSTDLEIDWVRPVMRHAFRKQSRQRASSDGLSQTTE